MDGEEADSRGMFYDFMAYFVQPVLFFVGIIGNVVTIVVLSRKSLRSSTTAVYLMAIATVSLIYVVFYSPFIFKEFVVDGSDAYVQGMVSYQCYFALYIIDSMGAAAIWITTAVGIERCIYILIFNKVQLLYQRKIAFIISGMITTASLLRNIPRSFECRPGTYQSTNATRDIRFIELPGYDRNAAIFADAVLSSIIPFVIIVICSIVMVYISIKRQRQSRRLKNSESLNEETVTNIHEKKMEGVTVLVLVNTILFTLSHLMVTILQINVFIHGVEYYKTIADEPIGFYGNVCSFAYFSFTSALYLLISNIYRRKLKKMFKSGLQCFQGQDVSENLDIIAK